MTAVTKVKRAAKQKADHARKAATLYRSALRAAQAGKVSPDIRMKLEQAAQSGHAEAKYALGWVFRDQRYGRVSERKSFLWMKAAADHGNPIACFNVGVAFEAGDGVAQSDRQAVVYYLKGAILGDSNCQFEISRCFHHGIGVGKNRAMAQMLEQIFPEMKRIKR